MMKGTGPMGLARSAGQALFDLAINDVDAMIGSRERFGALVYDRYIQKDEPTSNFFRVWENVHSYSLLRNNVVSFVAIMARIAAIELLANGTRNASQKDSDKI